VNLEDGKRAQVRVPGWPFVHLCTGYRGVARVLVTASKYEVTKTLWSR